MVCYIGVDSDWSGDASRVRCIVYSTINGCGRDTEEARRCVALLVQYLLIRHVICSLNI